jgi:hypothetical protein
MYIGDLRAYMCVLFCLCVQITELLTNANLLYSKILCLLEVSSNSHGVR